MLNPKIAEFLRKEATQRFLSYVKVGTRSDEASQTCPSTPGQLELARMIETELNHLGLNEVVLDNHGYLYAVLPPTAGAGGPAITFCAHLDTSPSESGDDVRPVIHENYDGGEIRFADDPELVLSPEQCPELLDFTGETIITAAGTTLLGADDKAGLASSIERLQRVHFPSTKR